MNLYSNAGRLWRPGILKKYFAVLLLQLIFTSGLFAQAGKQEKTITLTYKEVSATVLLKALQEQTGHDFNFSPADLDQVKIGPLEYKAAPLEKVLKDLGQYGLSFHQSENIISVSYQKPAPKSPNVPAGQSSPGTIKGRIVEFETSQPIPGASIRIIELNKGMSSDNEGYYNFSNIPPGKYRLQVSFIGFNTENQQVESRSGKEETYDIKMQGSNVLSEVVVSAVGKTRAPVAHTSEKQLVTEIKNMSVVASGISSQQISMSADRNAAQAVQKISGVSVVDDRFVVVRGLNQRYNLTYLNDNVAPSTEVNSRAFALDLIPSRIIDKILVYKSSSPENQADATGGVIKIYTKDAKTVRHFDLDFQLGFREGTTFNPNFLTYNGGKTDFLGFDDGTRALPKGIPGYGDLNVAQLKPSEYAELFNPTLSYGKKTAMPNMQLTANYYNAFKVAGKNLSSLTSFSYKNENLINEIDRQEGSQHRSQENTDRTGTDDRNTNTVQLNLLQNFNYSLNEHNKLFFKNFLLQQGTNATIIRNSHSTYQDQSTGALNRDIILSYNQRFLYAGNLGGSHRIINDKHHLQWNGGYTYSRQQTPDQRVTRLQGIRQDLIFGDQDLHYIGRGYTPTSSDDFDTRALSLGIISRLWSQNSEGVYNGSLDYSFRPNEWATLKIGTFQQWKERKLSRRVYTVQESNVNPLGTPYFKNIYVDENLVHFRQEHLSSLWSKNYLNDAYSGLYVLDRTTGSDTYLGTEQNNSAYFALTLTPWKWIEAHGGVRYEYNRQKIGAAIPSGSDEKNYTGINKPVFIDQTSGLFLPSVNLSLKPTDNWVLRLAYGKTVNRTEFREVSPFRELDFENNVILQGNVKLISATATNYDARLEFYPKNDKGDAISFGAFYKEIINPIERINTSDRLYGSFPSISYRNASSATVKGLELEVRKSLDFIPGNLFRNLSVIANGSIIKSLASFQGITYSLGDTIRNRPLQGQAPYLLNTGLYYDNSGWGSKIAVIYNYVAENIYAAGRGGKYNPNSTGTGINGPGYRGSLIELPRNLLDFSYTQRIGKGVQGKMTIQNVLNAKIRMAEDFNFSNKYEPLEEIPPTETGRTPTNRGDNIASSYTPGRFFNLAFSYSF